MSKKPDKQKFLKKQEPFSEWFKSVNHFLHEPPVKGFLDSIDDFFRQPLFPHTSFQVRVHDQADRYIIMAELPGVKNEQIGIDIIGKTLSISIKKQDLYTKEDDKNNIYRLFATNQQNH